MGADAAANADGSILPTWRGLTPRPPASKAGDSMRPDHMRASSRFGHHRQECGAIPGELTATTAETAQALPGLPGGRLSDPSQRGAAQAVLDNTKQNALNATTLAGAWRWTRCCRAFPSPSPKSGAGAMWNFPAALPGVNIATRFETPGTLILPGSRPSPPQGEAFIQLRHLRGTPKKPVSTKTPTTR